MAGGYYIGPHRDRTCQSLLQVLLTSTVLEVAEDVLDIFEFYLSHLDS